MPSDPQAPPPIPTEELEEDSGNEPPPLPLQYRIQQEAENRVTWKVGIGIVLFFVLQRAVGELGNDKGRPEPRQALSRDQVIRRAAEFREEQKRRAENKANAPHE